MAGKRFTVLLVFCWCAVFFSWGAFTSYAQEGGQPSHELKAELQGQLNALGREKAARTPGQKKMSSQLVLAVKALRGELQGTGLEKIKPQVDAAPDGTVLVDIKATVTPALLAEIKKLGGRVVSSFAEYDAIRANVPLKSMETLAEKGDVQFIRPADKAILNKVNTSEGDIAHAAGSARTTYNLKGTGVKVGVLSDSVDYLSQVQATGDLPAVTVLEDAPGNSGEGTAMLELVHDLAPETQLYFATAWSSPAGFATNIEALANAGCEVIVDDVSYLSESPFQDDIISQAVNTVTSQGVLYFSSAGNSGNFNDGTSGVWEGDYKGIASPVGGYSSVHDFSGGDWANLITYDGSDCYTLFWSDPLAGSANDYDLLLLDPTLNSIVAISDDFQNGTQDPYEGFCITGDATNYNLIVAKYAGEDRFLHLSTNRGELEWGTAGQISGHAAAEDGFGVAAVSAANRVIPFNGTETVETFSSDGPRRVFFHANGTAITPGNLSSTGGTVRNKPDIAAADGVKTATPGFNPFYGTSAAAPHAAAISALMLSAKPDLTISNARQIFSDTALDIESVNWDRDSGNGIIMADAVLNALHSSLTVLISGNGSGTVTSDPAGISCGSDCSENYISGTSVTLSASANTGSTASWNNCAAAGGVAFGNGTTLATCTFSSLDANKTVTATFIPTCFQDLDQDNYGSVVIIDDDGDGVCEAVDGESTVSTDCNDSNAAVHPGATELAGDGVDQNCDVQELCYIDMDNDGYRPDGISTIVSADIDCLDSTEAVSTDPTGDCNDSVASVNPGVAEICDGIDNNCNSSTDDNLIAPANTLQQGVCAGSTQSCTGVGGWVDNYSGIATYEPNTETTCDTLDNDCDGTADETLTTAYYQDADTDTYGNPSVSQAVCSQPAGYVLDGTDCNDSNAAVHPGAIELAADGVDQNCDAQELCYVDMDDDGYRPDGTSTIVSADVDCLDSTEAISSDPTGDCNDSLASVNPGASELAGDGVDQNCDGNELCFQDNDGDTFGTSSIVTDNGNLTCTDMGESTSNTDCDDTNADINPGVAELCDKIDNNCNAKIDEDRICGGFPWPMFMPAIQSQRP